MKKIELLKKLNEFKYKIGKYRDICRYYINEKIADKRFNYVRKLQKLQEELNEKFTILEPHISKYRRNKIKHDPSTGMKWDVYKQGIRGNVDKTKVYSLNDVINDLGGIIAKIEKIIKERPLKWSVSWRLGIVIIIFSIIVAAIIILTIRYGKGLNIIEKIVFDIALLGAGFIILRYLGYIIIGKERIKALGWIFTKFFKIHD